jgi:hypothetical protein
MMSSSLNSTSPWGHKELGEAGFGHIPHADCSLTTGGANVLRGPGGGCGVEIVDDHTRAFADTPK